MPDAPWQPWLYAVVGVLIASALSFAGVLLLALSPRALERNLSLLLSFAAGGLFGDAFIHLLPESFAAFGNPLAPSLLCILGLFLFLALERAILVKSRRPGRVKPVVAINLISDGVHNFIDGLLIGASFNVNAGLGITTTIAVILHEIPQEIGDFGILVHGGLGCRKALGFNFLSAQCALLGAVASLLAGPGLAVYSKAMLPVTAGGFIYIAGSSLIPDLLKNPGRVSFLKEFAAMLAGVGIMAALSRL